MPTHTVYAVCTRCGQELGRKTGVSVAGLEMAMRTDLPRCRDCGPNGKSVLRWHHEEHTVRTA